MESATRTLEGRRTLITGGASGIGLATARELVRRGGRVLVVDVQDPPDDLAGSAMRADVRDPADWERVGATARSELGGLDFAFLNAGVASRQADVVAIDDDEYRRVLDINVDGVFYGVRTAVPLLTEAGGGAIVATSSLAGLIAFAPDPVYTMAKHAVVGLVRALAGPLAGRNITINAVCPGVVDTAILTEEMRASVTAERFPMMEPQVIVTAVLERFASGDSGGAWVCQHGQPAREYRFRGVPGPAGHQRPPQNLSGI
jgi:NAD(P)-dependent dehydrogenase (short-subunit alcohol dehydrogenase family)